MQRKSLLAAFALLVLSSSALGQVLRRDGEFGDKIVGNIHRSGEIDMFVSNAVRDSVLTLKLGPKGKTPFRATFLHTDGSLEAGLAVYAPRDDFKTIIGNVFLAKGGRSMKIVPIVLPDTGAYRVLVSAPADDSGNPFGGVYSLKAKVKAPRKLSLEGTYDVAGEAFPAFDVMAGSVVKITVKAGPGSPLPRVADLLDPDGESLAAALHVKVKKRSVQVSNVELAKFGTHRLKLTAPTFGAWLVTVRIKPPRKKTVTVTLLDPEAPPTSPLVTGILGGEPFVTFENEEGGADELVLLPGRSQPQAVVIDKALLCATAPLPVTPKLAIGVPFVDVPDERGGADELLFVPGPTEPDWLVFSGYNGVITDEVKEDGKRIGFTLSFPSRPDYEAVVSAITYTDDGNDYLKSFSVDISTRLGGGTTTISDVSHDAEGLATGWAETRTFDDSGASFTFTVSGILRDGEGAVTDYALDVLSPGGPYDTIPFPYFTEGDNRLTFWFLDCDTVGFSGTIRDVVYTPEDRFVLSCGISVVTPEGPGQSAIAGVTRDDDDQLLGWTEARTYYRGLEKRAYSLVFSDIRRDRSTANGFRVSVTSPEGPLGSFPFPPWRLDPADEPAEE